MNLTNPNLPVTEERLSEFYQSILPYLGGMPEAICNKFDKANMYSMTEKIVGCWIDGKPVYQKVVSGTTASTVNTEAYIPIGASVDRYINTKVLFSISGYDRIANGFNNHVPSEEFINVVGITNSVADSSPKNNLGIVVTRSGWLNKPVYAIVQYTKTTDAANSFKWGDENDYSLDEKIVGTDENGDYVWQKTFICTCPTVTTDGTQVDGDVPNSSITNLKEVKEIRGIIIGGVSYQPLPIAVSSSNKILGVRLIYNYSPTTKLSISSSWTAYNGKTIKATLQYTKTTD